MSSNLDVLNYPDGLKEWKTKESEKFYRILWENNGKMFDGKNKGKKLSVLLVEPDPKYCSQCGTEYTELEERVCINCGFVYPNTPFQGQTNLPLLKNRVATRTEKDDREYEIRKIETDIK